jgi:tetratricopeptide (TPR) repeat protein
MNRSEDAIAVYDEVVERFGDAPEAALREQVAQALFNKGNRLGQMNRSEDAIAAYDEVVKRFGDAPEAALREPVAKALVNKGVTLGQMNRSEDAIAEYDEVVKRYGAAPEAALREQVANALNGKGYMLLCRAKQCWEDGAARQADLQAAAALFVRAVENNADKPTVWGNQAYAAFLLGQPVVARPLLRQALQQGGERLYQATLGDLEIHPVPLDEAFRAMLEELWAEVKPQS